MKTHEHIISWLLRAAMMLVTLTCVQTVMAQQDEIEGGEAFYIYQNDGHFDGFFYDEVKQMRYSRLDTLDREHDHYVSQEIVTEDSVYRIMLTAIDSVSFYQPEIKYAQGMRFMRDEGMLDYLINTVKDNEDKIIVTFRADMPADIRPKVGDVLSCPSIESWEEGAFVAKVDNVTQAGNILLLQCSYVEDLGDVFEQFITVEQVRNQNSPSGSRTIRRMAGLRKQVDDQGNANDLTLFNFSRTFEAKLTLYDKLKLQFLLNGGFGMNVSAAYKITLSEFYIKTQIKSQMSIGYSLGLDGELYDKADLTAIPGIGEFVAKFAKVPFPANFPILFVDMVPMPFARAEAHLNVSTSLAAQAKATHFMLEIKNKYPYVDMGLNFIAPFLPYEKPTTEGSFSINAQINGSFQTGLKFPITVSTLPWIKKCCFLKTGNTIYAGPKVSGNLNFDLWKAGDGIYEAMKDSKVDLSLISIDNELEGEATIFSKEWKTKYTKSWVYGNVSLKLFPEFEKVKYEMTDDNLDHIKCSVGVSGLTCLPERIGMGLYTKANDKDEKYTELYDQFYMPDDYWFKDNFNSVEGGFTKVEAGEYRLRPIITLPSLEAFKSLIVPVYGSEASVIIEKPGLTLDPEGGTFEEEGGSKTVKLKTRKPQPVTVKTSDSWIKVEVTQPDPDNGGGEMLVTVDPNNEERFREGYVFVEQVYSATEKDQKYFTIRQYGGLQLSASNLDIEADGGTSIIEILTSMKPITINLNGAEDWITESLDDRMLTLKFKENEGPQRTATITVAAWSEKHKGFNTVRLTVTQKGLVDVTIDPTSVTFEANGGTERVAVKVGQKTTFNEVIVSNADAEWLTVEKHDGYFNITAMPNTETVERSTTIDVSITSIRPDGKPNNLLLPVAVTQKFGEASVEPSELHFDADGGKQTAKVNTSTYPFCGILGISSEGEGWTEADIASDGTVTITTVANAGTMERECTVVCYVSGVKNPTEEQMIKLPVKVVQAGKELTPVTPDGDKSPFKFITFSTNIKTVYSFMTEEGIKDSIITMAPAFSFTPENSHFTVRYEKDVNYYVCEGYQEWETTRTTKSRASLSFSVVKKTNKVTNLRFNIDSNYLFKTYLWGVDMYTNSSTSSSFNISNLPLQTNGSEYKSGKWTAAEGLKFNNFRNSSYSRTNYVIVNELGYELYPDGISPTSESMNLLLLDDPENIAEITVCYKAGQGERYDMEWPTEAVMSELKDAGMPIYEGNTPPTIEGTYSLSALKVVADKIQGTAEMEGLDNMVLRFSGQRDGKINVNAYYTYGGEATGADGEMSAFIVGSGQHFTVCIPDSYGGAILISGEASNGSITDLYYSTTSINETGKYFIIKDGTGVSEKTTWNPGSDDED